MKKRLKTWSRSKGGIAVLSWLVARYMWLLYFTARKTIRIHPDTAALLAGKQTFIMANWHSRLFMVAPFWRHKGTMELTVISSPHADGLIVGGGAERLGLRPLRGTRGGQGGAKAMREAVKALKGSECLILNPDGPGGPARVLGEGTVAIAQLSGRPIVPMAFSAVRGNVRERDWDKAMIPRFFDRLTLDLAAPIYVDKSEDRESARVRVEAVMNAHLDALDAEVRG